MRSPRRTTRDVYPKLLTFSDASAYYNSVVPLRGHSGAATRPLAKGKRAMCPWRITATPKSIICMNGNHAVITYYPSGWVHIAPTTFATQDIAIIRAVAPVDTAKWDYRKDCLVVYAGGQRYTSEDGIWLPPQE